jgi:PIN domain nuclease of toxin-antitoxin system
LDAGAHGLERGLEPERADRWQVVGRGPAPRVSSSRASGVCGSSSASARERRRGTAKVAGAIAGARISAINYAEVVSHFIHAGVPEREVDAMLDPLPMTIVPVDKALAQLAGRLRAVTAQAGLSLGDRVCLALARRDRLPAWTSDLEWKTIADAAEVKVVAIR